jgi:hypothetical protein
MQRGGRHGRKRERTQFPATSIFRRPRPLFHGFNFGPLDNKRRYAFALSLWMPGWGDDGLAGVEVRSCRMHHWRHADTTNPHSPETIAAPRKAF